MFILRYRALLHTPALALDDTCEFLGVHQGIIARAPRENVTAHPSGSLTHRTVAKLARGAAAAGRHLPGQAGAALSRSLERFLQQNAGQRQPLSWEQRQAVLPYFEDDIRQLEHITGAASAWCRAWRSSGTAATARNGRAPAPAAPGTPPRPVRA